MLFRPICNFNSFIGTAALAAVILATSPMLLSASAQAKTAVTGVAVAPQYDTTHVYVAPGDIDVFVTSFLATFGGQSTKQVVTTVTPTQSSTTWQALQTPVGTVSLFGFKTPIPYPFGAERTGYLVTNMDVAIKAARAAGADILVAPFPDPIGRDAIKKAVAGRAAGFDMKVIYFSSPRLEKYEEDRLGVTFAPLDQLLKDSDFAPLHVPHLPQTHHLIGERELRMMKSSACLINTARDPIVDESSLVEALKQGRIRAAGPDAYENEPLLGPELAELYNVVLLPHVGSATVHTRTRMANMAADNLLAGLWGERPPNCLNCHGEQ
jgi:hypothetical protein